MSIRTVVTRGYGSGGSIPFVVTRGYSIGAGVVPGPSQSFYVDDAFEEKPRKSRRREREEVLEDVRAAIESKQPKVAQAERVAVSLEGTSTSDVAAALALAKAEPSEDAKAIRAIQAELRRREIEEDDAEVEMLLRALN